MGFILLFLVLGAMWCAVYHQRHSVDHRRREASRRLHQANVAVDDVFKTTRATMEERAGRRGHGETKLGDNLGGWWD